MSSYWPSFDCSFGMAPRDPSEIIACAIDERMRAPDGRMPADALPDLLAACFGRSFSAAECAPFLSRLGLDLNARLTFDQCEYIVDHVERREPLALGGHGPGDLPGPETAVFGC